MKLIKFSGKRGKGKFFKISDESFDKVICYKWSLDSEKYAKAKINNSFIRLHRFLMNNPKGMEIDHVDGDKNNYQLTNLRIATHSQNSSNKFKRSGTSSKYKGVVWRKASQKWIAQIKAECKYFYLGCFDSEEQAAKAYDEKAKKHFGEYARVNFVY